MEKHYNMKSHNVITRCKYRAFSFMFLIQHLPVNTVCPRIIIRILIVFIDIW